jgi:hypothetical protein
VCRAKLKHPRRGTHSGSQPFPISRADKVDDFDAIIAKHCHVLFQQAESDLASVGISAATSISYALKKLLVHYMMKSAWNKSTRYFSYIYA